MILKIVNKNVLGSPTPTMKQVKIRLIKNVDPRNFSMNLITHCHLLSPASLCM